jgi:O-antigen/teichoic acid export membrane protein
MLVVAAYLNLIDLGFSVGSQKHIVEAFHEGREDDAWEFHRVQFTLAAITALAGSLILLVIGKLFGFLPVPGLHAYAWLFYVFAGLNWAMYILSTALNPPLVGLAMFSRMARFSFVSALCSTIASLALSFYTHSAVGWMGGQALGATVGFILNLAALSRVGGLKILRPHWNTIRVREITKLGVRSYSIRMWSAISGNSDRLVLGKLVSSEIYTTYAVPARLPDVLYVVIRGLNDTLFPEYAKAQGSSQEEFIKIVRKNSSIVLLVALSSFVVTGGVSQAFLNVWLGSRAPSYGGTIIIGLGVYYSFEAYFASLSVALLAKGIPHKMMAFAAWNAAATAGFTYFAYHLLGVPGVAIMNAVIDGLQLVPLVWVMRRNLGPSFEMSKVLGTVASLAIIAISMAAGTQWVVTHLVPRGLSILVLPFGPMLAIVYMLGAFSFGLVPIPDFLMKGRLKALRLDRLPKLGKRDVEAA